MFSEKCSIHHKLHPSTPFDPNALLKRPANFAAPFTTIPPGNLHPRGNWIPPIVGTSFEISSRKYHFPVGESSGFQSSEASSIRYFQVAESAFIERVRRGQFCRKDGNSIFNRIYVRACLRPTFPAANSHNFTLRVPRSASTISIANSFLSSSGRNCPNPSVWIKVRGMFSSSSSTICRTEKAKPTRGNARLFGKRIFPTSREFFRFFSVELQFQFG